MKDWQEIATETPTKYTEQLLDSLHNKNYEEVEVGLNEFLRELEMNNKKAIKRQLISLMMHIIKWKTQSQILSTSWVSSINDARREIEYIREDEPKYSQNYINSLWDKCFESALHDAQLETGMRKIEIDRLNWNEVFVEEYFVESQIF